MEEQPFMTLSPEAKPTEASIAALDAQSKAEVRNCDVCGQPVDSGNRRSVLNRDGSETWRHAKHREN